MNCSNYYDKWKKCRENHNKKDCHFLYDKFTTCMIKVFALR